MDQANAVSQTSMVGRAVFLVGYKVTAMNKNVNKAATTWVVSVTQLYYSLCMVSSGVRIIFNQTTLVVVVVTDHNNRISRPTLWNLIKTKHHSGLVCYPK